MTCDICKGRHYLVSERDDGYLAIEACDACRLATHINDRIAALFAQRDGYHCEPSYPYYVLDHQSQRVRGALDELDEPGLCLVKFEVAGDLQFATFTTARRAQQGILDLVNSSPLFGGPFASYKDAQHSGGLHEDVSWWTISVGLPDSGEWAMDE